MKFVYGCVLVLYSVILAQGYPDKTESVKVDFELLLNKCKGSSCHTDRAAQGEAYITLEPEDPTFSWGYTSMEEEDVGVVVYQLRFHVSRISKGKIPVRKLVIGLSGRIGTLSGRQVTWSEKEFSGKDWAAFKMASTSGAPYSEGEETITPTLRVLRISIFP